MAQILFIHSQADRTIADFVLRAFANTDVKPFVVECADDTMLFNPNWQLEQIIKESAAVFILLTTVVANNKNLSTQFANLCNYATTVLSKETWIFEPADQFPKVKALVAEFKHYARFESTGGWELYIHEIIKSYDDSGTLLFLAATAGGGALIAQNDKIAGGIAGAFLGLLLTSLTQSNRQQFGAPFVCPNCHRSFQLHLTQGIKEFRCVGCGILRLEKNSPAFNFINRRRHSSGSPSNKAGHEAKLFMTKEIKIPTAFISYSWDSTQHQEWVRNLAARLREEGIDVTLDQWHLAPGDPLPEFMERGVRDNDFVLLICTPNFKMKSDARKGGVGYEGNIITGEIFTRYNHRKFIPILKHDNWTEAAPIWLESKLYLDLTDKFFDINFEELLKTLYGERLSPPALGTRRKYKPHGVLKEADEPLAQRKPKIVDKSTANPEHSDSPIKIIGIINEEITKPRLDGTRGSGLYAIPFRLSKRAPGEWRQLFIQNWNNPPSFTTMHRSGIAKVVDDKVILDGTTIEEVERYHRETLLLVIDRTNQEYRQFQERLGREAATKGKLENQHKENIDQVSKRIKFD